MQKKLPTYSLERIKNAFNHEDSLRTTLSARSGINEIGFSDSEVVEVIQKLTLDDFHKTMSPIHERYTACQDVYKPYYKGIHLYVKFQINKNGELIVSFKKK